MSSILKNPLVQAILALLILGAVLGLKFAIMASIAERQAWEGKITDTYKKRDWLRGLKKWRDMRREYLYYDYYWEVKCADGQTRQVEVPHHSWGKADVGDPVRKVRGERWPRLETTEAEQEREMKQRVLRSLFD